MGRDSTGTTDRVGVDGDAGDSGTAGGRGDPDPVVTAFVRHDARILLLHRSDAVDEFPGRWAAVSGRVETVDPERDARREIDEETGLADAVSRVRAGRPFVVRGHDGAWRVHPFLFESATRDVTLNVENDDHEWIHAPEIRRRDTVPDLWRAYEAVAPSVATISGDDENGAAILSVRALEVLRDRSGLLATESPDDGATEALDDGATDRGSSPAAATDELRDLGRRLRVARPSMAPIANRVDRAMSEALDAGDDATVWPGDLEAAVVDGIERALAADAGAADAAADLIDGEAVLTLSRSGTVERALTAGSPAAVYVAESRPAREGIEVAEELATELGDATVVTVHTDAAAGHVLAERDVDRVIVGSDAVLPDGRVVNKTGTRTVAQTAAREGVPTFAVAATDKVDPTATINREGGERDAVYDGEAPVEVINPTFDVTPPDAVRLVTERGVLEPDEVADVADELRRLSEWTGP